MSKRSPIVGECPHCGRGFQSKQGLAYHLEHHVCQKDAVTRETPPKRQPFRPRMMIGGRTIHMRAK